MADEGVGNALVAIEEGEVEGNVALRVTLVQLLGQLTGRGGG